jgi:hypothetical protein
MSVSSATHHARRARSQNTPEDKLDEIAKAIEELANAVGDIEKRVKSTEGLIASLMNRR